MRHLKTAVLAGASLLAMTAHAAADPISIGFFLFAGPLGSVFSFSTLVAAATLLPTAVTLGLSLLLRPGQQRIDPGEYKQNFENSAASEIRCVGRVRVGGLKAFGNTSGYTGFRLILHSKGPIDFVEEHYLGGRLVVVEADGKVSTPPWGVAPAVKPDGAWAKIYSKPGDGTETSWPILQSSFPTLWGPDHWVRGIAQSLVQFDSPGVNNSAQFGKLYQGGYPDYERVQRGELVYDPRTEATAWTDNGILCAVHILRSYPDIGFDDIDWDDVALEADKADVLVATKTGTEKRSRCWGFWQSEQKRGDVMQQVLDSVGAEISTNDDGKVRVRLIDDARTASLTYTDRHITSYTLGSGPEAPERPNRCRVSYYSPERNYALSDIDLTGIDWAEVQSEIDAYGEKPVDVELPFCPSPSQAQRIARRLFLTARADRGTIRTNMAGLAAWDHPTINVEFPDLDETAVCLIDPVRIDDEAGECEIPFTILPDLPTWNPATMEAAGPEQIPDFEYESDLDKPDAPSVMTVVKYPDDSHELRVVYDLPDGGQTAQAIYRAYPGGLPGAWTSMTEFNPPATLTYAYAAVDDSVVGLSADTRMQAYNSAGESSYYSDVFSAVLAYDNTAPAAPSLTYDEDSGLGEISVSAINAARVTVEKGPFWVEVLLDAAIRPNQVLTFDPNLPPPIFGEAQNIEYRARAYASDGTPGDYATLNIGVPAG